MNNNHFLVNQDSGNTEFFSPTFVVELAREVMGRIDLDPASCDKANETIKATHYYSLLDDGLTQHWRGKVWMNHPFHKGERACKKKCQKKTCLKRGHHITVDIPGNIKWVEKLTNSYINGDVTDALCITFASMSEKWMQPLLNFPQCFPHSRIDYISPDGSLSNRVTKGSVITYLGPNVDQFVTVFSKIGTVKTVMNREY
jgi:hypothetical protein